MSTPATPPGTVLWRDLTVENAVELRDFYAKVIGWKPEPHPMGQYDDYEMSVRDTGEVVAGVCHARGENARIPPAWLIYVAVANVELAAKQCLSLGGKVVDGPRLMGKTPFCVIQDPAGAYMALMEV